MLSAKVDNRLREISVNLYIVRQSNSIIILLFVQNISKFLTRLSPKDVL